MGRRQKPEVLMTLIQGHRIVTVERLNGRYTMMLSVGATLTTPEFKIATSLVDPTDPAIPVVQPARQG